MLPGRVFPLARAVLAAVAACGLLAGCSGGDGGAADRRPEVEVLELHPQDVPLAVELPARINAYRKAEVRPQVDGILMARLFTEGGLVRQGQPLYKIDPATYEAAVESARAEVARAEARLHVASLTLERRRALLGVKAVSRQAFEDAEAEAAQARADLQAARAALRTAEIRLRYTDVLAPITGRIGKSAITQGDLLTAHQAESLAVIQQLDPVYVDMTRSTVDLLRQRQRYASGGVRRPEGTHASVRLVLESGQLYPLEGSLQFSDITVDESTGMVLLRAVFPNPDGVLLPGMFVRAVVAEGTAENALLVPQLAVRRNAKGEASVFVLGQGDVVEERRIEATERVGANWVAQRGLAAGERVVVRGLQRLRHGLAVRVRAAQPPAAGGE